MSDTIIRVNGLSKRYKLGVARQHHASLRDRIRHTFTRSNQSEKGNRNSEFWALNDISFEVKRGDVLGVIGRNGAGKSTLLKILSRITEPTSGRAEIHGRVGSLLEVGTGFHPELTGRENVFLNGAILGMKKSEIDRKFDEIIAFSEVEKFIDTPVKRYSSGMYVRLAFAVAAHLEPEILIVDEVLAVGDRSFQKKCLGKMHDVAGEGRTVLFVSHGMPAIISLCNRAMLLESGRMVVAGGTQDVVAEYLRGIEGVASVPIAQRKDRQGNGRLLFTSFELRDGEGFPTQSPSTGQDTTIALCYRSADGSDLKSVQISVGVHGRMDENLFFLSTEISGFEFDSLPSEGVLLCTIPRLPLLPGQYSFNIFCTVGGEVADWVQNAGVIDVEPGDFFGTGKLPPPEQGLFTVQHNWKVVEESSVLVTTEV